MDKKQIVLFPKGVINAPPSKSMGHRALICAALCGDPAEVLNVGESDDIKATLSCLAALGAKFSHEEDTVIFTKGIGVTSKNPLLNCGESGSTLRFLLPLAAALGLNAEFTGQGRLMERPIQPYIGCFLENGASLKTVGNKLVLEGRLRGGSYSLVGNISSQFVSGLLFALPLLEGDSQIILTTPLESKAYVDMTVAVMREFGVEVTNYDYQRFCVKGGGGYKAKSYTVEGDFSAGAFMLVWGALGADVSVKDLNPDSPQGDKKILEILKEAGAKIIINDDGIKVYATKLKGLSIDVSEIPDLVPPLAVLFSFCEGKSQILNAARLRIKECDRLAAVTMELNRLGANIREFPDSLEILGVTALSGGDAHAHNDHRIAMMVATAAIKSTGTVTITQPSCVKKSYPKFWEDFSKSKYSK